MTVVREPIPHRADIQGLRAVAVLLVVLFHLWPGAVSGGYIGVDVFFVISGYLITSHILREIDVEGTISITGFWARRARRILPGALTVLAVTAIATVLWVPQRFRPDFFLEITASALYVENWSLAGREIDYLAAEDAPSPVQHFWTLSAEEQFYVAWPALVILGLFWAARSWRTQRHAVAIVLGSVTALSLAYSLVMTWVNPTQAYFSTATRAWEFGAGALLAFAPAITHLSRWVRGALSVGALGVLVGAGLLYTESTPMPGVAAILVVGATALFLAAHTTGLPVLRWRPVQTLGDISYAMYLWHWPLIILLPYLRDQPNGPRTLVMIFVLTIVLAYASTRLVEDPVRYSATLRGSSRRTYGLAVGAIGAIVLPSLVVLTLSQRALDRDQAVIDSVTGDAPRCFGAASHDANVPCENSELDGMQIPDPAFARTDVHSEPECAAHGVNESLEPCSGGPWDDPDVPKVALIGDSHAEVMSGPVSALADHGLLAFDGYYQNGCIWGAADPVRTRFGAECVAFKKKLRDILDEKGDTYDLIITAGRVSKLDGSIDEKSEGLLEEWSRMTDRGVPVVAIADGPEHDNTVNTCLEATPATRQHECGLEPGLVLADPDPLVEAAARGSLTYSIDLTSLYCDDQWCPGVIGGATVYRDSNHFTATFARTFAPALWRELVALGLTD